jgi:hypothetical protein
MSEIEKDFDDIQKEVSDKINQAVQLLNEARKLAYDHKLWSAFSEHLYPGLRDAVGEFVELDSGWDHSGCSF